MLFEIDFTVKIKSNFKTIYSTIVFADTVKECRAEANEIARNVLNKKYKEIRFFIQEFIAWEEKKHG